MGRIVLIITLCLAIVFLGIAGVHLHVPNVKDPGPAHAHAPGLTDAIHAVTLVDVDREIDHVQHGDIDIEPLAKAFGKGSLNQLLPAVALLWVAVALLAGSVGTRVLRRPPPRPPKRSLLLYFLPPPHAPPAAA